MRFWVYLPIVLIGQLLAYPLVPLAVWLCDEDGRLPRPLRWLETHDAVGWYGPLTEPATRTTMARYGKRAGLLRWLWRNKAYRLRYMLRARLELDMPRIVRGTSIPARWGFSHWYGQIGPYWEWQPRIGFGKFHLYLRMGWKMKPFFDNPGVFGLAAGIFTGVSLRVDDWDDYGDAP